MAFVGKMPATLKFEVPIKADGTIANDDAVKTGTKQISWSVVDTTEVLASPTNTLIYSRINQFVLSIMNLFDNINTIEDSNKIIIELEAGGE